ncbi:MAG: hypothetical protein KAJ33_05960 [Thermoplasmata archaeon]|nr:hypothetical protein [Thermoplasmata archaeon]
MMSSDGSWTEKDEDWWDHLHRRNQVVAAYFRLTGENIVAFDYSMREAMNRLGEEDQIKMIIETEIAFSLIEDPPERLRTVYELKWKL